MKVFLSGEIHSNWRQSIIEGCQKKGLNIEFLTPETVHEKSDDAGDVLGTEENPFWKDHKSAKINSIRIANGIKQADLVVVKFGEKYRQWNAAFDAGFCAALGKPYLVIHPQEFTHALKEVNAVAKATASNESQIIEILAYLNRS